MKTIKKTNWFNVIVFMCIRRVIHTFILYFPNIFKIKSFFALNNELIT